MVEQKRKDQGLSMYQFYEALKAEKPKTSSLGQKRPIDDNPTLSKRMDIDVQGIVDDDWEEELARVVLEPPRSSVPLQPAPALTPAPAPAPAPGPERHKPLLKNVKTVTEIWDEYEQTDIEAIMKDR
ncbi:hypothetical protein BSKO_14139 [Bryopsis sp. KO-2023]|nr:hypothetical protein BSKO_14139 [Bryopsis sp. KO-2023]